jgi:hypothetical protein
MKAFLLSFGAIGLILYVLLCFGFVGLMLYSAVYGLYLAFSASVLLGIIVLFAQPGPCLIGLVMIFFHKDIAQAIVDFLTGK